MEAALPEATRLMTRQGIERLPVVDEKDRLVDIVTRRDLLQVSLRSAEEMWQAVRREVFADALQVSPQISEVAVHNDAVTLTGQLESGAEPPSRWVRRARWTVSPTSCTTSPAASTTGTHRPPDRPSTEWPTTGCAGHAPTDPTHRPPALRPRGAKALGHGRDGPPIGVGRPPSRWSGSKGPAPRPAGRRCPQQTYLTRINGGPATDHRRAHRRGVLPDGEPGRIGQAVPENLLPTGRRS
ncbi:CBS domain-containing protein [Streptomyces sp. NPDC002580]|uniref:CBS domain-containing protein n=1 Tax=Streptomyces sp. NPDC002580 TaxID=3364653 RepID=UPI0036B710C0